MRLLICLLTMILIPMPAFSEKSDFETNAATHGPKKPMKIRTETVTEKSIAGTESVTTSTLVSATTAATAELPVTHDLMVLYTPAALAKHTQVGIDKLVLKAVAQAQATYDRSGVYIRLRLVGSGLSPTVEGTNACTSMTAFRQNALVKAQRDMLRADMAVLLIAKSGSGYLGCANLTYGTRVEAFASVMTSAIGQQTFTHEVGHLQGLAHNLEDAGWHAYPWGVGYRLCVEPQAFRDVMSYKCPSPVTAPRIAYLGNPAVLYNGYPTGSVKADPARALNDNALHVASYR